MRAYAIVLGVLALLAGILFRAAEVTGENIMRMFAVIGFLFIGAIGTMAVTRLQAKAGMQRVEEALKTAEPECLITDWAFTDPKKPDYLLVAPGGLIAVCVDEMPQSWSAEKAAPRIGASRERVQNTVRWLRDRLSGFELTHGEQRIAEVPVGALLVLVRRKAQPGDSAEGITVLNPEELAERLRAYKAPEILDEAARIRLTRHFRQAAAG